MHVFFLLILFLLVVQPANADDDDIIARIRAGDAASGKKVYQRCIACHTIDKRGEHRVGPNLYGIIGRRAGGDPTYGNYSEAMQNSEIILDYKNLDLYLENSKLLIPKNRMAHGRMANPQERADIIQFLRVYHDNPPPLKTD